jgi:glucose/mannose-6-phosphate isomerase
MSMFHLIKDFPAQITEALEIGNATALKGPVNKTFQNILVAGMGGSGIGGNILSELLRPELGLPIIVNKGYALPACVNELTLVILCSYSGNTEETLQCAADALAKGIRPVCITSGGKLEAIAQANGLDIIKIPGGHPPRACLAYSTVQLFYVLKGYGLISGYFEHAFKQTAVFLTAHQPQLMAETEKLAAQLAGKVIIAYAEDKYESTVLRLKQQINENGKMHCWHNVLPELNHNELVGWRKPIGNIATIIFRADDENKRNAYRIEFTKKVIESVSTDCHEVIAQGETPWQKRFYLIHWGDWLSYYLCLAQGFDPFEIDVLNNLKNHMGSIK